MDNPEDLEVAPGTAKENLAGWIPTVATEEELRLALEKAFDYRGDVTITLKSGEILEGYIFDRRTGPTLAASIVRIFPAGTSDKRQITYADIAALKFSDRDPAAGKSWETWVKKYAAKKAAGETNIGIDPEKLD